MPQHHHHHFQKMNQHTRNVSSHMTGVLEHYHTGESQTQDPRHSLKKNSFLSSQINQNYSGKKTGDLGFLNEIRKSKGFDILSGQKRKESISPNSFSIHDTHDRPKSRSARISIGGSQPRSCMKKSFYDKIHNQRLANTDEHSNRITAGGYHKAKGEGRYYKKKISLNQEDTPKRRSSGRYNIISDASRQVHSPSNPDFSKNPNGIFSRPRANSDNVQPKAISSDIGR
jgi:hypothetical protein